MLNFYQIQELVGTVVLNSLFDQEVTRANFYNLTISGAGVKTLKTATTIINNTVVNSYLQATFGGAIDFQGDVTINTGATFEDMGETHTFKGSTWTGTGNYTGGGKIVFCRSGNQTIRGGTFNNLEINSPITNNYTLTLAQNPVLLKWKCYNSR
jgi:hypothetical protein